MTVMVMVTTFSVNGGRCVQFMHADDDGSNGYGDDVFNYWGEKCTINILQMMMIVMVMTFSVTGGRSVLFMHADNDSNGDAGDVFSYWGEKCTIYACR